MTERVTENLHWDAENRLLSHLGAWSDDLRLRPGWDSIPQGRRRGATQFLVDANRPYQEVLEEWATIPGPTARTETGADPRWPWSTPSAR